MVNFKEISIIFQGSRVLSSIFQGGGAGPPFFRGEGGGSNCLFHIETHISCDFPGGSGPPPLDPHLVYATNETCKTHYHVPSKLHTLP